MTIKVQSFFRNKIEFYKKNRNYRRLKEDIEIYRNLAKDHRFPISESDLFPCLEENTNKTLFDPHYIYHPAWAARIIKKINPEFHVDISSTLNFCTIVSAFVPVHFYDFRPANLVLNNLTSEKADLTDLNFESNSIISISCMHTIEHIGLGRYGDRIDPEGDLKAIHELKRVTKLHGNILMVVPIGKSKLVFNAHRIYSCNQIIENFDGFTLNEFSLVPDDYEKIGIMTNPDFEFANKQNYGCGCFWFIKNK
jgi:hypothetical protein